MSEETDELVRAVTELIGNIRCAKNVAAIATAKRSRRL
jgi:hypothetical protein